jgi:nucleoside-diphosphate-sugar epimerase
MINVLDGCIEYGVKELILASSSEVYQTPPVIPTPEHVPLSVPDPLNPRYSYGGGKIISELMAINYGRKYFDRVIIFRPHNVYGPDMGYEHVIPQFILRMNDLRDKYSNKIPFPIQGSGKETRAFVYIDDFTEGLLIAMEKGQNMDIFHIGTQDEVPVTDLAYTVADYFGVEIEIRSGEICPGGTLRRCPDITKLKDLGYKPKVSLKEGIFKSAEWYVKDRQTLKRRERT